MFRGRILAENQGDMFLCCRFFIKATSIFTDFLRFFFSSFFSLCIVISIRLPLFFSLKQSNSFFQVFFHFYFCTFIFSRKQIPEDDKAMDASVVFSLSANDAHFSQTHFHDYQINSGLKKTHTLFADASYNLIYCNYE